MLGLHFRKSVRAKWTFQELEKGCLQVRKAERDDEGHEQENAEPRHANGGQEVLEEGGRLAVMVAAGGFRQDELDVGEVYGREDGGDIA